MIENLRICFLFFVLCVILVSCSDNSIKLKALQSEINNLNIRNDSLEKEIQHIKPGLGDLMLEVQVHHNKLFFAGKSENWSLAQFEHDEIDEIIKQAETIEKERNEVKLFKVMLYPQLDSIQKAITIKDEGKFYNAFSNLTAACNNCHTNTKYGFNRITEPEHPPYSNQEFQSK